MMVNSKFLRESVSQGGGGARRVGNNETRDPLRHMHMVGQPAELSRAEERGGGRRAEATFFN